MQSEPTVTTNIHLRDVGGADFALVARAGGHGEGYYELQIGKPTLPGDSYMPGNSVCAFLSPAQVVLLHERVSAVVEGARALCPKEVEAGETAV